MQKDMNIQAKLLIGITKTVKQHCFFRMRLKD